MKPPHGTTNNQTMETKEIVELMLKSSDHNPYTGMLSKKDNLIAAIDLAKLCKDFADKGQIDEAMNIPSEKWVVVISELEGMSLLGRVTTIPILTILRYTL